MIQRLFSLSVFAVLRPWLGAIVAMVLFVSGLADDSSLLPGAITEVAKPAREASHSRALSGEGAHHIQGRRGSAPRHVQEPPEPDISVDRQTRSAERCGMLCCLPPLAMHWVWLMRGPPVCAADGGAFSSAPTSDFHPRAPPTRA